jgi:adenylate cyclase
VNVVLIVLLGMATPVASLYFPPIRSLALAVALGALFAVAVQLAFNGGTIVSFVYPLLALVIASIGAIAAHYLLAAFERERVKTVFSRFVPEAAVNEVLARTDEDLRLGGVRRKCTVLFSDIRGFTTFSETREPDVVVDVLNHYHGEMTEAIMEHGGTLVSFIGDGIMAIFGAPLEQEDHADRALAASREMLDERLERVNDWMRSEDIAPGFRIGIGLNSGTVMSGNIGSERRLEYTAIGDTVNTASRLEGMTKGTQHQLFVSDTTREALKREAPDLVYVDELEVRGRAAKIKIWSIDEREREATAA